MSSEYSPSEVSPWDFSTNEIKSLIFVVISLGKDMAEFIGFYLSVVYKDVMSWAKGY